MQTLHVLFKTILVNFAQLLPIYKSYLLLIKTQTINEKNKPDLAFALVLCSVNISAQNDTPDPFDYGKMWTFENPPKEWFKEAYNFTPEDKWFDDVRKSSLAICNMV